MAFPDLAKGPIEATIAGLGIDEPIVLDGRPDVRLQDGKLKSLTEAVAFWDLTYTYVDSPLRPAGITTEPPTMDLGPRSSRPSLIWDPVMRPTSTFFCTPKRKVGGLGYVEPDVEIDTMRETTSGGWYVVGGDLSLLMEDYGVDMALAMSESRLDEPPGMSAAQGWLTPLGLLAALRLWAVMTRETAAGISAS